MKVDNLDEALQLRDRMLKVNAMIEAYMCGTSIQTYTYCGGENFVVEELLDSREIKKAILPLLLAEQARVRGALATLGVES